MTAQPSRPAHTDIAGQTWFDRMLPEWSHPYGRLARWDRPIGFWLLFLPCLSGTIFAADGLPDPWLITLFAVGAFAMRGAGCTINDMADRNFDRKVERTAVRPLASGRLSMRQAWMFLGLQLLVGLAVLVQLNPFAIALGFASMPLVAAYPFAKRVTDWPQSVLGLTFNWGALMGWAAVHGELTWAPVALYAGCFFWTIAYDTIYAHQDKEDDAIIGVRSTALLLGRATRPWVGAFFAAAVALWAAAGWMTGSGWAFYAGLALVALHFANQTVRTDFDNPPQCLSAFKSNRNAGLLLAAALIADRALF
jgi:4-hydroxybenzoate polyprenyltransferase